MVFILPVTRHFRLLGTVYFADAFTFLFPFGFVDFVRVLFDFLVRPILTLATFHSFTF